MHWIQLFKKYPFAGLVLCTGLLVFGTAQNILDEAAVEGIIGKPRIVNGIALQKSTHRGRGGSTVCAVTAEVQGAMYNGITIDCNEWAKLGVNDPFVVVATRRGPASLSNIKGQFYFSFLMLALEITGIFYCLSLLCDRWFEPPQQVSRSRREVTFAED